MTNTCSNDTDLNRIKKLDRLVEKMNQLAFVNSYGWQNPKITYALGLKHGDNVYDTIYSKYTRYCIQASLVLVELGCFKTSIYSHVYVDTERLMEVLKQIPALKSKYLLFHTTVSDVPYPDGYIINDKKPVIYYPVTAITIPSYGPKYGRHDDPIFYITIPYEIGMDLPDNSRVYTAVVRSVVGKGRWKL